MKQRVLGEIELDRALRRFRADNAERVREEAVARKARKTAGCLSGFVDAIEAQLDAYFAEEDC